MTPRPSRPAKLASSALGTPVRAAAAVPVEQTRTDQYGAHRDAESEGKTFVHRPTVALPVGTVATNLPRAASRTKYDWAAVRSLMEDNPGLWVLALHDLSSGMYSYVRRAGPSAFTGMGGHMQVSLRNQKNSPTSAKGKIGELWVRWIPANWTEQDQARAEAAHAAGEGVL